MVRSPHVNTHPYRTPVSSFLLRPLPPLLFLASLSRKNNRGTSSTISIRGPFLLSHQMEMGGRGRARNVVRRSSRRTSSREKTGNTRRKCNDRFRTLDLDRDFPPPPDSVLRSRGTFTSATCDCAFCKIKPTGPTGILFVHSRWPLHVVARFHEHRSRRLPFRRILRIRCLVYAANSRAVQLDSSFWFR